MKTPKGTARKTRRSNLKKFHLDQSAKREAAYRARLFGDATDMPLPAYFKRYLEGKAKGVQA